jgi:hypothetical protein
LLRWSDAGFLSFKILFYFIDCVSRRHGESFCFFGLLLFIFALKKMDGVMSARLPKLQFERAT